MGYQKIQSLEHLRPYIESIWIQEDLRDAAREEFSPTTIIPTTRIDMLFFYGDPFLELDGCKKTILPRFYLIGQKTRPNRVAASGKTGIIIFSFKPGGAQPFFNLPLHECVDQSIPLRDFMNPAGIDCLEERVLNVATNAGRVAILQDFLISRLRENTCDSLMLQSAHYINRNLGNIQIERVARATCLSQRQYERRFRQSIGMNPHKFATVIRFQKALLMHKQGAHWADIAAACGYYDQSHFIKEMKTCSGFSPNQILSASEPSRLKSYFNRDSGMSHFYNTLYL